MLGHFGAVLIRLHGLWPQRVVLRLEGYLVAVHRRVVPWVQVCLWYDTPTGRGPLYHDSANASGYSRNRQQHTKAVKLYRHHGSSHRDDRHTTFTSDKVLPPVPAAQLKILSSVATVGLQHANQGSSPANLLQHK